MSFIFKDEKNEKQAASHWNNLINLKKYFVPQTTEEYIKFRWSPKITIDSSEYFFDDKLKKHLNEFIASIYSLEGIQDTVTYITVYQSTIKEIEFTIIYNQQSKSKITYQEAFKDIFNHISEKRNNWEFFFTLEGFSLEDVTELDLGNIKIVQFDESLKQYIYSFQQNTYNNNYFNENILELIDTKLLQQVVIKCLIFGDLEKAKEIAQLQSREVINYFRYLICVLFHERIAENVLKINIVSQTHIVNNYCLVRNIDDSSITLYSSELRDEKFIINKDRLRNLKEEGFFDDIVKILNNKTRTELEGYIITAIYWTGEAQDEFDRDVAFLKYWTALESIFSHKKEKISQSLAKGVSVLLTFGGYNFIEVNDIKQVYKRIGHLYSLRSKIIHRGLRQKVSESELAEICKYTSWVILTLLDLRTEGYTKLEQIDVQTTRLYDIVNREKKDKIVAVTSKIQQILEELSKLNSTDTILEKMASATEAVQRITNDTVLMQEIRAVLKLVEAQTLGEFINHPATSFIIAAIEELNSGKKSKKNN